MRKLRFTAQRTMRVAQRLYEGLPIGEAGETGLITYMRTDSTRLADDAVQETQAYIVEHYGKDYVAAKPRKHRQQKGGAGGARGDPAHLGAAHAGQPQAAPVAPNSLPSTD